MSRQDLFCVLILTALISAICAPPPPKAVPRQPEEVYTYAPPGAHPDPKDDQQMLNLAYERYLQEVVKALESDDDFQEKMRNMNEEQIKRGDIAHHLDEVNPDIRSRLNEAKLKEIDRLRQVVQREMELEAQGGNPVEIEKHIAHLDAADEAFSKEDLQKLIKKTVADLEELDNKRRDEFKEYEMKKQAEYDHKLSQLSPEERAKAEQEHKQMEEKHKEHPKLKHPGSKDQLEEVWEESDGMDPENFDPKTFFGLHDLDGNGVWDEMEVEALFQKELDKMYNESNPEDDMKEREEEMERMREHVVREMDKNGDQMISLEEFMQETKDEKDFNKDEGWEGLDQQDVFTDEELQKFEREYAEKMGWDGVPTTMTPPPPHAQPQGHQPQQQEPHVAQDQVRW